MNLKTILVIVAVFLAGFSICLFLGYLGYYPFIVLWEETGKFVSGLNFDFSNPTTLITTGIGAAGTAVAVGAPLLSKLNSAKQQAQETAASAKSQIDGISGKLDTTTSQLQSAELNLSTAQSKITSLEQSSHDWQTKAQTYEEQLNKLTGQYSELQKLRTSDMIGLLPAGTVMPNADGSKTVVVEKTVVK
jgi:hypothetical protein